MIINPSIKLDHFQPLLLERLLVTAKGLTSTVVDPLLPSLLYENVTLKIALGTPEL